MKTIEIRTTSGLLHLPLAVVSNVNYSKQGNIIETRKNVFRCRGFGCQSLAVSISLTPGIIPFFAECNEFMKDYTFPDLCNYFLDVVKPNIEAEPFNVYVDDNPICPELMFSITSVTNTFQGDFNGTVEQMDISLTLSGVRCSKAASRNVQVSYDEDSSTPDVVIHCNGNEMSFKERCSITRFEATPTTLNLEVVLGDSFNNINADAWIKTPSVSDDSYIIVDGYGKFYIKNASWDGDFLSYECSIFSKQDECAITKTVLDAKLSDVFNMLSVKTSYSKPVGNIDVSNYTIHKNSIDTLKDVTDALGLLVGFKDNTAHVFTTPESISPSESANLAYFIDTDIESEPTTSVIYRDGIHEYRTSNGLPGHEAVINSPVCTTTDRSSAILKYYRLNENSIELTIPLNTSIRHYSMIALAYQNKTVNCMVSDYSIDFISNSITLRCVYVDR